MATWPRINGCECNGTRRTGAAVVCCCRRGGRAFLAEACRGILGTHLRYSGYSPSGSGLAGRSFRSGRMVYVACLLHAALR